MVELNAKHAIIIFSFVLGLITGVYSYYLHTDDLNTQKEIMHITLKEVQDVRRQLYAHDTNTTILHQPKVNNSALTLDNTSNFTTNNKER